MTDGDGNVTTIERAGATPTAIVAPGGQRTTLSVNGDGWLSSVTNPAGEAHTMSYSADGLLQQFIDPLANIHTFTYDALGRLIKDEDPVGGSITLGAHRAEQRLHRHHHVRARPHQRLSGGAIAHRRDPPQRDRAERGQDRDADQHRRQRANHLRRWHGRHGPVRPRPALGHAGAGRDQRDEDPRRSHPHAHDPAQRHAL